MKILKLSWWAGWWNRFWFEWHWFRTDKENVPTESQLWSEKEVFQSDPVVRLRKSYLEAVTGAEAPFYGRSLDTSEEDDPLCTSLNSVCAYCFKPECYGACLANSAAKSGRRWNSPELVDQHLVVHPKWNYAKDLPSQEQLDREHAENVRKFPDLFPEEAKVLKKKPAKKSPTKTKKKTVKKGKSRAKKG